MAWQFVRDGFARAGEWTKYDLYLNGYRHRSHAARCPQTMRVVEQVAVGTEERGGGGGGGQCRGLMRLRFGPRERTISASPRGLMRLSSPSVASARCL